MAFKPASYIYLYENYRIEVQKYAGEYIATAERKNEDGEWKPDGANPTVAYGHNRNRVMMEALISSAKFFRNMNLAELGDDYYWLDDYQNDGKRK